MKHYTTTDGTSTDPAINYSECYAPLNLNRGQYEEDLKRRQKEHLDSIQRKLNAAATLCLCLDRSAPSFSCTPVSLMWGGTEGCLQQLLRIFE